MDTFRDKLATSLALGWHLLVIDIELLYLFSFEQFVCVNFYMHLDNF
jgi:hypothetical protein